MVAAEVCPAVVMHRHIVNCIWFVVLFVCATRVHCYRLYINVVGC